MKTKIKYTCQECGHESAKWLGKCPNCSKWNTIVEEIQQEEFNHKSLIVQSVVESPRSLTEVESKEEDRLLTGIKEFDRLLGGGVVPGSLVLIGGEPGIGKSTLLLQAANALSKKYGLVLYISGEESVKQTKLRADRTAVISKDFYIASETNVHTIVEYVEKLNPKVLVIDSIQTIFRPDIPSASGSVSQVRESCSLLVRLAKTTGIPIFIVGHVTKDGTIAGPRVLEHLVDTVLYFEGECHHSFRILRAYKNRFGSTNEIAIFEMREKGLIEVENPSEIFLSERADNVAGSVIVPTIEGTRPILVELQALVCPTNFPNPQRRATGIDYNKFVLLLAVLEKRAGLHISYYDVFVNVAGGVKIVEPASDLGLILAIASSFKDIPIVPKISVVGEVGLGGEVRAVSQIERRINESLKLGFSKILIPYANLKDLTSKKNQCIGIKTIQEALNIVFK